MKNDTLKILSEDTKKALIESIASKAVESLFAKTKEATDKDSGSFKVVVSTADQDRQGESVRQEGWDLTFFKSNPIVLWAHDYSALPIGMCTSIEVKEGKLIAEGKFAPVEANPFAQQVRKLYDLGMINTTSVGFIPKEFDREKDGVISKSELLEFSFVPVPANPYALRLSQVKELGIDVGMLKVKGLEVVEVKEEVKEETEVKKEEAETKGEVAEELEEMKKRKWMQMRAVYDVICALECAYFSEETPPEDFGKLVQEASDILKSIAGGATESDQKSLILKLIGERKYITVVALGSIARAEGKKEEKGEVLDKGSKSSKALKEINTFVEARELLRSVDKTLEKVLQNFNEAARNRKR